MIFVLDRMIKAETGEGSSSKALISTDVRMCSTLNKGKTTRNNSRRTKVVSKISTEEAIHREEDFMAEEAEEAEEEDFSREPTFSVCFVEKTRATLPNTVRSPSRRRKSLRTRRTRM